MKDTTLTIPPLVTFITADLNPMDTIRVNVTWLQVPAQVQNAK